MNRNVARMVFPLLVVVAAAACGDSADVATEDPADDTTSTAPATPDPTAVPAPEYVPDLPNLCGEGTIGGLVGTEHAAHATIIEIGPREAVGAGSTAHTVTVQIDDLIFTRSFDEEIEPIDVGPGETLELFLPEATVLADGLSTHDATLTVEGLADVDQAIIFFRPPFFDHQRDGVLTGAATLAGDGSLDLSGFCTEVLQQSAELYTEALGLANPLELIEAWADAIAAGAEEQFVIDLQAATAEPPSEETWNLSDPPRRPLNPTDAPEAIAVDLDLRVMFVELDDFGLGVIGAQTETGASAAVTATAAGVPVPVYFLPGADTTITVVEFDLADEGTRLPIASVDLAEVTAPDTAGFLVTGTTTDTIITVLSEADVAQRLGVDPDQLEGLRETYLTRPDA